MAKFCLTQEFVDKFKEGLRSRVIDPLKMADMDSKPRRDYLAKFVGEENAKEVNALFESKLLLKNQKAGYISWAKKVAGLSEPARRDLIARIERMDSILNPAEGEKFLNDLADSRLGVEITKSEAKAISDFSHKISENHNKADIETMGKLTQSDMRKWLKDPVKNSKRLEYGRSVIALDNYLLDLKYNIAKQTLKELLAHPFKTTKEAAGTALDTSKSVDASMDNNALFNQGSSVLMNFKTSGIWFKNALNSFKDLVQTYRGKAVWDEVRADIVSRPNNINGLYKDFKLAVNVVEEAFPTSIPEKLATVGKGNKVTNILAKPVQILGKAYKASEVAFNAFQTKNRADAMDLYLHLAEKEGIPLKNEGRLQGMGQLINSLTARGSLGKLEPVGNIINAPFFSLRRQVALVDSLTGYQIGEKGSFVRKQGAIATMEKVISIATILAVAKALDPNSVETDTRSADAGKIRVGDTRFTISSEMAYLTLAMRILTQETKSSTSGKITPLNTGKYGDPTIWDAITQFGVNKFSPFLSQMVMFAQGKDRQGNKPTIGGAIAGMYTPLGIQNMEEVLKNPNSANFFAAAIADGIGILTNTYPNVNSKTKMVPEGAHVTNDSFINAVQTYAKAMGTDPETAFNRIFTGQKIVKVTNGTVMVERMSLDKSQNIKKKAGKNNPQVKLDHTIPLELGGSNDTSNLKLVTTSKWRSYTPVENALAKALKDGKINKNQAQSMITSFKSGSMTAEQISKKIGVTIKSKATPSGSGKGGRKTKLDTIINNLP